MWEAKGFGIFDGQIELESGTKSLSRALGTGHENAFVVFQKRMIEAYYEIDFMKKEAEYGFRLFSNPTKVKWLKQEEHRLIKKAKKNIEEFFKLDLKTLTDKELVAKLDYYIQAYQEIYGFYHVTQPQCFEKFNARIQNQLTQYHLDALDIFLELSTPSEPSIIAQEDMDRKKMFISFLKGTKKEPLIQKHLQEYRFLSASEGVKPWNERDMLESFKHNTKDALTLEHELQNQMQFYPMLKKKQDETIKKYKISKELQEKFAVFRHFGNSRLLIRYYWCAMLRPYVMVADEIAERRNIAFPRFGDYTIKEVGEALLNGKMVSSKILKERFDFGIVALQNDKTVIMQGKKANAFYEKNVPKESNADFVKGMIASKGVAEGIAKVIRFDENIVEQMNSMKRGQILIAGQTRPILMPAIEKASAIVTDEGGITSHAAIVSREFNIPCIVGTHNATRIFKDGDRILVDANTGIVKKVK